MSSATCRARAAGRTARCSRRGPRSARSANIVIAADRGLCGGYNSTVIRTAERDMREQERAGRENALVTVGRKAEGYFRFRDYPIDAASRGFSDSPTYEDARQVASAVVEPVSRRASSIVVQLVYTRFISAGRQEVVIEPLLPLESDDAEAPAAGASAAAAEPSADYEFEPEPRRDPRDAAAALHGVARVRGAAQRGGVRARGPPARDEGRDRQRRRADPHVPTSDEPGPSGLDHDRDHGDRRRRRSPAARARATSTTTRHAAEYYDKTA